ncbi:MAG: hypothetical protein V1754_09940, partial [Pseudomonadota bacterium]
MKSARGLVGISTVLLLLLVYSGTAAGQQGKILEQKLDANGEGYSVLLVWGTHYDMGYAQGNILAEEIIAGVGQVKEYAEKSYLTLRQQMAFAVWQPTEVAQELDGMLAGIKAAIPSADLDVIDLKVINTFGDWRYACRSHSAWDSFVTNPTKTLSTRRLDFGAPIKMVHHHLLVARKPSDDSVRWINLAWPGYVASITGVNEFGTLASLHDYQTQAYPGPYLPRSLLPRLALTMVKGLSPDKHLDAVYQGLQNYNIATGTFLTYYVPEGYGGVITCTGASKCFKKRLPQNDYFNGQVLITTNSETSGHTVPEDGEFMDNYYKAGGTKTIVD